MHFVFIKLKMEEWLSISSNCIKFKTVLNLLAFLLITSACFLSGGLSHLLFWFGIADCIFITYLNYKYK